MSGDGDPQLPALLGEMTPELADLAQYTAQEVHRDLATSTLDLYAVVLGVFERWCAEQGLSSLPASPEVVAVYISHLEVMGRTPATIAVHLAAIAREHGSQDLEIPTSSPLVRRRYDALLRRHAGQARRTKRALSPAEVAAMARVCTEGVAGHRDRCLLLVGFAAGLRRSELVALEVEDMTYSAGSMVLRIRRSKTDQHGGGTVRGIPLGAPLDICPIAACARWRRVAGIESGPLLRPVDKHGTVHDRALGARTVLRVIKKLAARAEIEDATSLGGHSLRRGCITAMRAAGADLDRISSYVGHANIDTTAGYVEDLDALSDVNPLRDLWRSLAE